MPIKDYKVYCVFLSNYNKVHNVHLLSELFIHLPFAL